MTKVICPTCFHRVDRLGPRRRFHVVVSINGDEWKDVACELRDLLQHIVDHGPTCNSASGGYATAHFVVVTERPEQTHEKWEAELEAHLAAVEQEEVTAAAQMDPFTEDLKLLGPLHRCTACGRLSGKATSYGCPGNCVFADAEHTLKHEHRRVQMADSGRDAMMPEAFYLRLDAGIRFAVRVLHAAGGMETCQSCQGGEGARL